MGSPRRVEGVGPGESDDLSKVYVEALGCKISDVLDKRDRQRLAVTAGKDWEKLWRSGRHCPNQTYESNCLVQWARADESGSSV